MAAHTFWAFFCSSRLPSQIGQTAKNDGAAIVPGIDLVVHDLAYHVIGLKTQCLWFKCIPIPCLHSFPYIFLGAYNHGV